jgi:hypothetical protein
LRILAVGEDLSMLSIGGVKLCFPPVHQKGLTVRA